MKDWRVVKVTMVYEFFYVKARNKDEAEEMVELGTDMEPFETKTEVSHYDAEVG